MNEDSYRVDHAWYFLSLDLVRPYLKEMWFPFEGAKQIDRMRQQTQLEDDLPTYGSDPELRVYRNLSWFEKEFGVSDLNAFVEWQGNILQIRGPDRVAEDWWHGTIFQIVRLKDQIGLQPELSEPLESIKDELHALNSKLDLRLKRSQEQISTWDQTVLSRQALKSVEDELQTQMARVANTIHANHLALAWQKYAQQLAIGQLVQLRKIAEDECKELGGPPYGGVPLPGIWQPFLAAWLKVRA